jgi:uncharacterized SAM-binding protein YcdF (DUF218 family)
MTTDEAVQIVWEYHYMHHALVRSDIIMVLCSRDTRVAERGAELFLEGWAPTLLFSGGFGRMTKGVFAKPEAEVFANVAIKMGVPEKNILIENASTNTGENVSFTQRLLKEKNMDPKKFILVQKPYVERRTYATFKKVWPEKDIVVTSPQLSFEEYVNEDFPKDYVIQTMLGHLQRIKVYPEKGFQIPQDIPENVWEAYEHLLAKGYTEQLITYKTPDVGRPEFCADIK